MNGEAIKAGDIVIAKRRDPKFNSYLRWRVESMNVGQGKRWSWIVDYPLVKGQEPIMIETQVLCASCRKAAKEEREAIVVCLSTKTEDGDAA